MKQSGFTLLELLVSVVLLALLSIFLFSILNAASEIWRDNESRAGSFREARAALHFMARELDSLYTNPGGSNALPVFVGNPSNPTLTLPVEAATNETWGGRVFFLTMLSAAAQDPAANKSDLCAVGYYLAYTRDRTAFSPSGTGAGNSSYKIYRHSRSSNATFAALLASATPNAIFQPSLAPGGDEILARNITRFEVRLFRRKLAGGLEQVTPASAWPASETPAMVELAITAINDETAAKLATRAQWEDPTSARMIENAQRFSTRIHFDGAPVPTPTPKP